MIWNSRYLIVTLLSGLLTAGALRADDTASLLPNAIQYFMDANGKPLSNGKVYMYTPSTTTPKTTWTTADKATAQPQPFIPLGISGKPASPIYGDGSYRQLVKDQFGNTIWDFNTASTGTGGSSTPTTVGDGNIVGTVLPWPGLLAPPNYVFAYGQAVSRTGFPLLYSTITQQLFLTCVAAQPVLSGIADTTQIKIGSKIEASCIPPGSTVLSKATNSVTISNNASTTASIIATFFPFGNGDGSTTVNLPDLRGYVLIGRNNMGGTAGIHIDAGGFNGTNPNALGAEGGSSGSILLPSNLPPYTPSGTIASTLSAATASTPVATLTSVGGTTDTNFISLRNNANTTSGTFSSTVTGTVASIFTGTAQGGTSARFSNTPAGITLNYIIKVLPDVSSSPISGVVTLGGMSGNIICGAGLVCAANTVTAFTPTLPLVPTQGGTGVSAQTFNFITAAPYSALCDGVTETHDAFQAAIDAAPTGSTVATTYIDVPPGAKCALGLPLDFKGHPNLKLRGYGGEGGGNSTPSIIYWTGTSGTRAMDFRDSLFNGIDNIALYSTSTTFTGILVDAGGTNPGTTVSSGFSLTNTTIGSTQVNPPPTCLNVSEAVAPVVENNNFTRCGPAIHGQNVLGQNTVTKIRNNLFIAHVGPAIKECGESWLIENNAFEADASGNANSFLNTNTKPCRGISFISNWFGDINQATGTGTQITLTTLGLSFTGNALQASPGSNLLKLDGGSGFSILGNYLNTALVGITCVNTPTGGRFNSNTMNAVTTPVAVFGNCLNFNWENNTPDITPAGSIPITVGATPITAGTSHGVLTDNAGLLGNTAAGTNGQVLLGVTGAEPQWGTMSDDATITNAGVLALTSTVTAGGPTGSATVAPIITYDAKGRLTAVSSATITPAASSITGSGALTKTDDTNVTLTLGGTPTSALLAATSITVGWTGTLANSRLATMATNTVKGNATSGTASPTDLAVGTCSTASSALTWTTNTGFGCNTSITAATVAASGITGQVALANGGTAANLTASNGGIFYSTASAGAILAGTATARQMLQSGASTTPAWSTATWPATTTINRLLYSSAANTVAELATANSSILVTSIGGVPSLSTTLPAFTLGGTVDGGSNTINNVVIGGVTPLAGTFTTLTGNTSVTSPLHYGGSAAGSTLTVNGTSNGSPSSAYLLLQSNGQNVAIGNTTPKAPLDLNTNLSSSPALVVSTSLARMQAADASFGGMEWVSYGSSPGNILTGAVAGGTSASPTATPAQKSMFNLRGYGYTGSAWALGGIIIIRSNNAWTGSSQGSMIDFYTTPEASTTIALAASFNASGGFSIGTATDPGIGGLQINGQTFVPNAAADTATADSTACIASSGGKLLKGTGTLGICLGTSGRQFKTAFAPLAAGMAEIAQLKLWNYRYRDGFGDGGARQQYGPTAQDVEAVLPDLVRHDASGQAINYDLGAFIPISLHALQQLNSRITKLEQRP
jgi:hypothetical protein